MNTATATPRSSKIFAIVDENITEEDIEKIMQHDRFAIQNVKTSKIIVGMRWSSNQGIKYRTNLFKGGKVSFGVARNTTFVAGIGVSLYEDIRSPEFEPVQNPLSKEEADIMEKVVFFCDFGDGEQISPTYFTTV